MGRCDARPEAAPRRGTPSGPAAGPQAALAEALRRGRRALLAAAYAETGDAPTGAAALALLAERVARALHDLPDPSEADGWLLERVREAARHARGRALPPPPEVPLALPPAAQAVDRAVRALAPAERLLLCLATLGGLAPGEAARAAGLPAGEGPAALARAAARLAPADEAARGDWHALVRAQLEGASPWGAPAAAAARRRARRRTGLRLGALTAAGLGALTAWLAVREPSEPGPGARRPRPAPEELHAAAPGEPPTSARAESLEARRPDAPDGPARLWGAPLAAGHVRRGPLLLPGPGTPRRRGAPAPPAADGAHAEATSAGSEPAAAQAPAGPGDEVLHGNGAPAPPPDEADLYRARATGRWVRTERAETLDEVVGPGTLLRAAEGATLTFATGHTLWLAEGAEVTLLPRGARLRGDFELDALEVRAALRLEVGDRLLEVHAAALQGRVGRRRVELALDAGTVLEAGEGRLAPLSPGAFRGGPGVRAPLVDLPHAQRLRPAGRSAPENGLADWRGLAPAGTQGAPAYAHAVVAAPPGEGEGLLAASPFWATPPLALLAEGQRLRVAARAARGLRVRVSLYTRDDGAEWTAPLELPDAAVWFVRDLPLSAFRRGGEALGPGREVSQIRVRAGGAGQRDGLDLAACVLLEPAPR